MLSKGSLSCGLPKVVLLDFFKRKSSDERARSSARLRSSTVRLLPSGARLRQGGGAVDSGRRKSLAMLDPDHLSRASGRSSSPPTKEFRWDHAVPWSDTESRMREVLGGYPDSLSELAAALPTAGRAIDCSAIRLRSQDQDSSPEGFAAGVGGLSLLVRLPPTAARKPSVPMSPVEKDSLRRFSSAMERRRRDSTNSSRSSPAEYREDMPEDRIPTLMLLLTLGVPCPVGVSTKTLLVDHHWAVASSWLSKESEVIRKCTRFPLFDLRISTES
mmetsp:Transcript_18761/g.52230  ORF Transcript_18761/g.52230 Transcript_18761/m.52230 type:complete len:273 (+) Transcript_18761:405-1223(+)